MATSDRRDKHCSAAGGVIPATSLGVPIVKIAPIGVFELDVEAGELRPSGVSGERG